MYWSLATAGAGVAEADGVAEPDKSTTASRMTAWHIEQIFFIVVYERIPGFFRRVLLAQHHGQLLIVGLNDHTRRLPLVERVKRHRKRNNNGSAHACSRLKFGLGRKRRLDAVLECRESLKVSAEVYRANCIRARLTRR